MRDLEWTEPTFFESEEDEVALKHAIARYHALVPVLFAFLLEFKLWNTAF
jgi:hypothetical protein